MVNPFEAIFNKLDSIETTVNALAIKTNQAVLNVTNENNDELIDLATASEILHMPPSTIHYHKKLHQLPFLKPGKRLLFRKVELLKWVEEYNKSTIKKDADSISTMLIYRKRYAK